MCGSVLFLHLLAAVSLMSFNCLTEVVASSVDHVSDGVADLVLAENESCEKQPCVGVDEVFMCFLLALLLVSV